MFSSDSIDKVSNAMERGDVLIDASDDWYTNIVDRERSIISKVRHE